MYLSTVQAAGQSLHALKKSLKATRAVQQKYEYITYLQIVQAAGRSLACAKASRSDESCTRKTKALCVIVSGAKRSTPILV